VALAQSGIGYAVATLGTATTPMHVQKLLRQAEEIVFCFDGDDAGRRAAWRALENSLEQLVDGKQLSFLFLPQGEDPDTYVRKLGQDEFEKLLGAAVPLSQFMLRELSSRVDLNTHEGRARLLQEARPLVKQVAAPLLSLMLRKQLAQMAGISQPELDKEFQVKSGARAAAPRISPPVQRSIVRSLLEIVIFHPEFAPLADRAALEPAQDVTGINQSELKTLVAVLDVAASGATVVNWPEYFRDSEHAELLRQVESGLLKRQEVDLSADEAKAEFGGGWAQLLEQIRRGQLTALNEKSKKQELTSEDKDRYRRLSQTVPAAAPK